MIKFGKPLAIAAVSIMMMGSMSFMTGCDTVKGLIGQGDIGKAITTSKGVETSDKEGTYGYVQDINGNQFLTVLYFQQTGKTGFEVDKFKDLLSQNNINWYQLIASSGLGTNQQQYGVLYFAPTVTYNDMANTIQLLAGQFDGSWVTQEQYDAYCAKYNKYDIYHSETVYYGPAAQKQEDKK